MNIGTKRHVVVVSSLLVFGTLLATTDSRGDGALNADQSAAQAQLRSDVKSALDRVKEECGVDVKLVTDFENFDRAKWLDAQFEEELEDAKRYSPTGQAKVRAEIAQKMKTAQAELVGCPGVLQAFVDRCRYEKSHADDGPKGRGGAASTPATPAAPYGLTSVACLVGGQSARQKYETIEEYTDRSMSFANGVFTVHMDPRLRNVDHVAGTVLQRSLRPGALPSSGRAMGAPCTTRGQCRSFACVDNVCKPCGSKVACSSTGFCDVKTGICFSKNQEEPSSPSGSSGGGSTGKKRGKGLGQSCKSTSECESGRTCTQQGKFRTCQ